MSYNNIFSDNSHLSHRILKDPVKVNLGDKLNKVRDRKHAQKEIAIYDVNDKPTFQNVSDYGITLLDTLSLADLKASILETSEEAIRLTADSNNEINFFTGGTTASNLRLQITDNNTTIKNNLLVDNIKDEAGNTSIKSTTATNTSFTKQTNTFQFDNSPSTGYISIHNSNSSQSGYMQWYSYSNVGPGSYPRNAYMGLSSHVGGGIGNDLKLSLENNVNFNILKDSTSVMNFDNVNNKIVVSNPIDIANIRDVAGGNAISLLSNELRFKKPVYIEYANRKLTLQAGSTDNIIYNKNSGLNLGFNIGYNPTGEVESITTATQNTSKVLIDNTGIALKVSDVVNVLPLDVLVATNSGITCSKDVNIEGTNKVHFSSNNYFANDATHNLKLFINNNKYFEANTGNSSGYYQWKIANTEKLKISDSKTEIYTNVTMLNRKRLTLLNAFHSDTGVSIGQNDECNEINGTKSTNSQGVNSPYGHLRLSSGEGTSKTTIDLYGQGTISSNRIETTIENVKVNEITKFYYDINIPTRTREITPAISEDYSLGSSDYKWADVWAVNGAIQTSDRNMKKDIKPITNGLQTILSLEPVSFIFKNGGKRTHSGYIAQDTKNKFCDNWAAFVEDENGCGLRYTELVSVNSAAIKDLYSLLTTSDKKPIIIKEQVKSEDHKCNCNSVELISQLNSYEIELLEKGEQLKVLDSHLEDLTDDNISLKKNSNIIIERLNELELKNKELENRLNEKLNEKTNDIIDEDTDGGSTSLLDSLQIRNHENELKISKLENKLKRLSTIINKLVKNN